MLVDNLPDFGPQFGRLLLPSGSKRLRQVSADRLKALLSEHRLLALRDFDYERLELLALTNAVFDQTLVYPGKRMLDANDPTVCAADPGGHSISLHCELSYLPYRPDVGFFWHMGSPRWTGGETLFCDGHEVAAQLSQQTLDLFRRQPLRYYWRLRAKEWARLFGTRKIETAIDALTEATGNDVVRDGTTLKGTFDTLSVIDNGTPRGVWATSLMSWADYNPGLDRGVCFAPNTKVPPRIREELSNVTEQLCYAHQWAENDILIFDNWRCLHGRSAAQEGERLLDAQFGFLRSIRATERPLPSWPPRKARPFWD